MILATFIGSTCHGQPGLVGQSFCQTHARAYLLLLLSLSKPWPVGVPYKKAVRDFSTHFQRMELALSLREPSQSYCHLEESTKITLRHGDFSGKRFDGNDGMDRRPVPLDLLPFTPVLRNQSICPEFLSSPTASTVKLASESRPWRPDLDVNRLPEEEMRMNGNNEVEVGRTSPRGSDDDDSHFARKKLRLSKEQSAFLEESFREQHTLTPKQKSALAKQLNLRPRQVEVWFQNRRARTKLKQTEVDCEYLRRMCEALTQENRRMQKEVQELRALKSAQPFYSRLPPTTLTICPSCERAGSIASGNSFTSASCSSVGTSNASSIRASRHGTHDAAQKRSSLQS